MSTPSFADFIVEQLAAMERVNAGRFFGGVGLSANSVQFAMLMGNSLYFTVDDTTRPKYEQMGSVCFSYGTKKGRVQVKKYFQVPAEVIEDRVALVALAKEAVDVAHRSRTRSTKKSAA
ncbi:MAG: TfoX/Sxy family protein [Variovorax sp.]